MSFQFMDKGGDKMLTMVAEGTESVGVWMRGIPSPKKIFVDLSLKEAINEKFAILF